MAYITLADLLGQDTTDGASAQASIPVTTPQTTTPQAALPAEAAAAELEASADTLEKEAQIVEAQAATMDAKVVTMAPAQAQVATRMIKEIRSNAMTKRRAALEKRTDANAARSGTRVIKLSVSTPLVVGFVALAGIGAGTLLSRVFGSK